MPLASGDGVLRRGHLILAIYVGDYPEQVLVTGCKTGECPKCPISRTDVGEHCDTARPLRSLAKVLDALDALDEGPRAFAQACRAAGIKPLSEPFWADLPYTNIFYAITPDILHQLYQGVVKHLLAWLQEAYGTDEIDARCRRLPPNHNLRHFSKGISSLSRVTGKEHQDICRILLGLIIGLPLPHGASPARLVRATRALLDFLYLAQYSTHTSETLHLLRDTLKAFHANKNIFVDLGIRTHFRLPKLHSLNHYLRSIELYGTTDNYDTQYSERLHIDLAKDAYRATNRKDELSQMTKWLERKEKVLRHSKYVTWRLNNTRSSSEPSHIHPKPPPVPSAPPLSPAIATSPSSSPNTPTHIQMTRHPSVKAVKITQLASKYGATFFHDALARFVVSLNHPGMTPAQIERASDSIYLNFQAVPVFHKVKFWVNDPHGLGLPDAQTRDVVHVRPSRTSKHGGELPGRFDTALVRRTDATRDDVSHTIAGHPMRDLAVVQVRLVFKLPEKALHHLFPRLPVSKCPRHLAYVEWFTPLTQPHPDYGLYRVTRELRNQARLASVVPVERIERSCHLYPEFGPVAPRDWSSSSVLEDCQAFYVNSFLDRNTYKLVY